MWSSRDLTRLESAKLFLVGYLSVTGPIGLILVIVRLFVAVDLRIWNGLAFASLVFGLVAGWTLVKHPDLAGPLGPKEGVS